MLRRNAEKYGINKDETRRAGLDKKAWHLQQRRKISSFIGGSCKRELPNSGRESVDPLLREAASQPSRARSGSAAMVRSTAKASNLEERRSCSRRWRRRNLRSLGECLHYITRCPAHYGGLSRHRLCSTAAAIGLIVVTAQTNRPAVSALFK